MHIEFETSWSSNIYIDDLDRFRLIKGLLKMFLPNDKR